MWVIYNNEDSNNCKNGFQSIHRYVQRHTVQFCIYMFVHNITHTHVLSGYTDMHVYIIIPSSYIYKHVAKVTIYTQKYNIIRCMKILFVERGL